MDEFNNNQKDIIIKLDSQVSPIVKSAYGTIYLFDGPENAQLIFKKYNNDSESDKIIEGTIMKSLSNYLFIASVYDIIYCNKTYGLLMPYYKYPFSSIDPTLEQVFNVTYQLLSCAEILRSHGIIHRDFKPNNIVIDNQGYLKIIDFGLSCYQRNNINKKTITIWYRAPEVLEEKNYNYKVDLWSIGCILSQLILGQPLFEENNESQMLLKIQQFDTFKLRFSTEIKELEKNNKSIDDYNPKWPFLKKLKIIYQFSKIMFYTIIDLLEINPKKRKDALYLLNKYNYYNSSGKKVTDRYKSPKEDQLIDTDVSTYRLIIPSLKIDQIKYKTHSQQITELNDNLYKQYNGPIKNELINYSTESDSACVDSHIIQLLSSLPYIIDQHLDILVESINLYTQLIYQLKKPENSIFIMKITDLLYSSSKTELEEKQIIFKKDNLYDLFKISYTIIYELISDEYRPITKLDELDLSKDKYHYVRQLVIDLLDYKIKQNKRLYHSAKNLQNFDTYNVTYNLLYIMDPAISHLQYNYVVCFLQSQKHGQKQKMLPNLITDNLLIERIQQFVQLGWIEINQRLEKLGVHKQTISNCKKYYQRYCKRYRKNRKVVIKPPNVKNICDNI